MFGNVNFMLPSWCIYVVGTTCLNKCCVTCDFVNLLIFGFCKTCNHKCARLKHFSNKSNVHMFSIMFIKFHIKVADVSLFPQIFGASATRVTLRVTCF